MGIVQDSLFLFSFLPHVFLLVIIAHITQAYFRHRTIPGPFIAKFTDLWRLSLVWRRGSHTKYLALHKKYGDLVRIGPNSISVSQPDLIPSIYGIGKGFIKSDFYSVWQNMVNGKRVASMVFTTDEAQHAMMKRPVAPAYSLSTLVEFEPLIDSTTAVFLSRLDELFADTGGVCDLGKWLGWYAFDVIGELTFSKRLGFLERGEDVEGIGASVAKNFDRCSVLGQMPWVDMWTYKNPIYLRLFAKSALNPIIGFGQRRLNERLEGKDDEANAEINAKDPALREKVLHGTISSKPDFLSRFLKLHKEQPDVVTDRQLLAYLFMNINAGSDTISSTVRALFYYLLKNPESMATLVQELREARKAGNLTIPLPTWAECQSLPYLNAAIKEALRLNPALALPMERVVPVGGLVIGNTSIAPGTVVGINPWVLHRDPRIFGSEPETWEPKRWIPKDASGNGASERERIKYMEQHLLSFGAGKRTCLGRHIAMLELTKMVPAVLMRYDIRLANPESEWKVVNSWAIRQEGLEVKLSKWEV